MSLDSALSLSPPCESSIIVVTISPRRSKRSKYHRTTFLIALWLLMRDRISASNRKSFSGNSSSPYTKRIHSPVSTIVFGAIATIAVSILAPLVLLALLTLVDALLVAPEGSDVDSALTMVRTRSLTLSLCASAVFLAIPISSIARTTLGFMRCSVSLISDALVVSQFRSLRHNNS